MPRHMLYLPLFHALQACVLCQTHCCQAAKLVRVEEAQAAVCPRLGSPWQVKWQVKRCRHKVEGRQDHTWTQRSKTPRLFKGAG